MLHVSKLVGNLRPFGDSHEARAFFFVCKHVSIVFDFSSLLKTFKSMSNLCLKQMLAF